MAGRDVPGFGPIGPSDEQNFQAAFSLQVPPAKVVPKLANSHMRDLHVIST